MPPPPDTVALAYVHNGAEVAWSWHDSVKQLLFFDAAHHGRIMRGGEFKMRCAAGGLAEARDLAVEAFLADPADWFFWVDTDMGFEPDSLERLLEAADPAERPIMGGLCFAQKEIELDGYGGYTTAVRPTIFDWLEHEGRETFMGRAWYPPHTVVRCAGTGAAFLLIHRTVLERMATEHQTWFGRLKGTDGKLLGEDTSFCVRAGAMGYPIHVHTGVKTTHHKAKWVAEQDFWDQQLAPPATEPVAVLVPVLNRPANAAPFMQSLRASTGLAAVHAVCEHGDDDTELAWRDAGAQVVMTGLTSFAEKVNVAYRATREPWLFLVGDDVRFWPGWLDHAQYAATVTGAEVVGTNDLHNPRVTAGEHASHMLIRRSYVDDHGASWDGPGLVAHEGYGHWFVDDEIVTVAKQRGLWAMALASKVEHRHPLFGNADDDDVYRLGQSKAKKDQALFRGRAKAYASRGA